MATEKKIAKTPEKQPEAAKYTVAELTAVAAGVLHTTQDVVKTALKLDGKEFYSLEEAKAVVKKFSEKKIQ